MTFLADTFEKLANDPSWPWTADNKAQSFVWNNTGHLVAQLKAPEIQTTRFIAQSPLTMARLALMVVDEIISNLESNETEALKQEGIDPSHYANVKKRVEQT